MHHFNTPLQVINPIKENSEHMLIHQNGLVDGLPKYKYKIKAPMTRTLIKSRHTMKRAQSVTTEKMTTRKAMTKMPSSMYKVTPAQNS